MISNCTDYIKSTTSTFSLLCFWDSNKNSHALQNDMYIFTMWHKVNVCPDGSFAFGAIVMSRYGFLSLSATHTHTIKVWPTTESSLATITNHYFPSSTTTTTSQFIAIVCVRGDHDCAWSIHGGTICLRYTKTVPPNTFLLNSSFWMSFLAPKSSPSIWYKLYLIEIIFNLDRNQEESHFAFLYGLQFWICFTDITQYYKVSMVQ